jgi:hypothetical protein
MKNTFRIIFLGWLATGVVQAGVTNNLSDGEIQGRELAAQLLAQAPAENQTNSGVLKIRGPKGRRAEIPVQFEIIVHPNDWVAQYETLPGTNGIEPARLIITHDGTNDNRYELNGKAIAPPDTAVSFAGSDFWAVDLGLDFFHWPDQRVLKKAIRRSRGCVVLESKNPNPKPGAYTRVMTWIDQETDGIIHAEAWGADGKMVKEFDPKEFKKVNGQWQLQEMDISNPQTGSRTRLEFNLDGQ